MTDIICDTMIWYELGKKTIGKPDHMKYNLVCTYLTFVELAFTPNILKTLPEVRAAVQAIFDSKAKLILQFPIEDYRSYLSKEIPEPFDVESDVVFGFIRMIYNSKNLPHLRTNKNFNDLLWLIETRRTGKSDYSAFKNEVKAIEQDLRFVYKKYYNQQDNQKEFRQKFLFSLNNLSLKQYSEAEVDWVAISFYEKVFMSYLRKLRVSFQKHKANDEPDLDNMMYVRPGNKYWTLEKGWLQIFKEEKLQEYQYLY
jgi:hypothetical protein